MYAICFFFFLSGLARVLLLHRGERGDQARDRWHVCERDYIYAKKGLDCNIISHLIQGHEMDFQR